MASQPPQRDAHTNAKRLSVDFRLSDEDNANILAISRESEGQSLVVLNANLKSPRTNPNGTIPTRKNSYARTNSYGKLSQVRSRSTRRLVNNTSEEEMISEKDQKDMASEMKDDMTFLLPEISKETSFEDRTTTEKMVKESWSTDHVMLLYMLSRYAVCAKTAQDKETWIREIPLIVLMYEGIAAGVLDFDYAPAAMLIPQEGKSKRIWMNVTQDGKSAIDDLREANLINGLKLSSQDFHSITAFQVSLRGLVLLNQVGKEVRGKVDSFIYAPKPYRRELLKIRYIPIKDRSESEMIFYTGTTSNANQQSTGTTTGTSSEEDTTSEEEDFFNEEGRFALESIGYLRYSEVTETEDVSYVSSPFIPLCVRGREAYEQLRSNSHRALEAAKGQSNIRDTLAEAITLSNPVCIVGEWIPFGSNQIVALNERLGSMDRCQGGLFTSLIDDRPTDTQFEVPPGLTEVKILDYDPVRFINFEAEINFPEEDGIVQVEHFGIHLNVDGSIFYGIKVDAILDRLSDKLSIDLLSRLLVDIHQDSSEVMDDLLSSYQNSLLDMVFLGDIENRGKFNMILAEEIDPFMAGVEYMDRGDYENELKQILGDIHCSYDIGEDSVMIVGRDGILVAGSASKRFEQLFVAYFSLLCREMFLRSFFTRIFILEERLKKTRRLILNAHENPNHLLTIRNILNQASSDLILFTDTLGYLIESLEFIKLPSLQNPNDQEEKDIHQYLDLTKQHHDILVRAKDLEKLVHGAKYDLINLRQMAEVLNTSQLEDIFKTVELSTRQLADETGDVMEKSNTSLEISQYLLAGSFAFTLIDRISGGTLHLTQVPQWIQDAFVQPLIEIPFVFFILNLVWMGFFMYLLYRYKQNQLTANRLMLRVKINQPILVDKFELFLKQKNPQKQESDAQVATEIRRVVWQEKSDVYMNWRQIVHEIVLFFRRKKTFKQVWKTIKKPIQKSPWYLGKGNDPMIEVEYDSRYGFLSFVTFHCRQPNDVEEKKREENRQKKIEKMKKKQQQKKKKSNAATDVFAKIQQGATSSFSISSPASIITTTTTNNNNNNNTSSSSLLIKNEKQQEDLEHHLLRTFEEDLKQHQVIHSVASFLT